VAEEVWIGLAGAEPLSSERLDGAGAYMWIAAPASGREEFERRVREMLTAQDLELFELEDVEPAAVRAERLGFSPEIADLALRAAWSREGVAGTVHVYESDEDEDDSDDSGKAILSADEALAVQQCVDVRRVEGWDVLDGFIVGAGRGWILLHELTNEVNLGGWCAIRRRDLRVVEITAGFKARALALRGDGPQRQPDVALEDVRSVLSSIQAASPLLAVHTEADDPSVCYIGRIESFTDDCVVLATVDPDGSWSEAMQFRYADITRVDFGGGYEQALALVAFADD
jgi:hypothetical protein